MKKFSLFITYANILQLITGLMVIFYPGKLLVARLGIFYEIFSSSLIGAILMLVGVFFSIFGLLLSPEYKYRFLFFIPQFIFILLTAGSALHYVFEGQYADGVIRPWQFIFIDQLPSFISAFLYFFSIFDFRKKEIPV